MYLSFNIFKRDKRSCGGKFLPHIESWSSGRICPDNGQGLGSIPRDSISSLAFVTSWQESILVSSGDLLTNRQVLKANKKIKLYHLGTPRRDTS